MDRGAWWAIVHEVAVCRTALAAFQMELGSSPRPPQYSNCWWPALCVCAARVLFPVLQLLEVSPTAFSSFAIFIIQ